MLLTYDAPSPSMQTVRAVVGGNNIGVAPGSLMDVFDPSGALIPAPRADSMRAVHAANYGGPQVRRDLVVVGNGLLRLGGAAVDAHLDALRREKLALDIAWQQRRSGDERSSGWVAGIGWYDL